MWLCGEKILFGVDSTLNKKWHADQTDFQPRIKTDSRNQRKSALLASALSACQPYIKKEVDQTDFQPRIKTDSRNQRESVLHVTLCGKKDFSEWTQRRFFLVVFYFVFLIKIKGT